MFKFKGFTLAEVLITLMIIGIVAALTIPSVIANAQQQEFKTGLRKAVSVLNEAIQTNIALDGETPYDNEDLFSYLQKHMSILKTRSLITCYDENGGIGTNIKGETTVCMQNPGGNSVFYTTDGMRFEFLGAGRNFGLGGLKPNLHFYLHETGVDAADSKCTGEMLPPYPGAPFYACDKGSSISGYCGSYGLANNPNNTKSTPCVIMVDVNGDKKPNPVKKFEDDYVRPVNQGGGRSPGQQTFVYTHPSPTDKKLQDIFSIMITDEKAIPFGVVAQRAMYSK